MAALTLFDPPPRADERPARLADPFAAGEPHPLARRAAELLLAELARAGLRGLDEPGRGKMFGVLVVLGPDGRVGWLRGFSGMLEGRWLVDGWAPPLFDVAARDVVWIPGQAELRAFEQRHERLAGGERRALERARAARSNELLVQLVDGYAIGNARGARRSLRELHAPEAPPGGAGDCAGPKLVAHAHAHGLTPLALAEFWWGAPPLDGGRIAGAYYPACRRKCGRVLPFMLDLPPLPAEDRALVVVYEDASIVVVDKPVELPTAPDRHDPGRDSVITRLRASHGDVRAVGSLDPEASGLVLAARDDATHARLQRAFARGEAELRHVAWLDGIVEGERGTIELPLRLDFAARPRRIHDPRRGKRAVTDWRVLARAGHGTQVELVPRTGRTHQLRVHAALGLRAPIVGDALYGATGAGADADRLLLHATTLVLGDGRPPITCPISPLG